MGTDRFAAPLLTLAGTPHRRTPVLPHDRSEPVSQGQPDGGVARVPAYGAAPRRPRPGAAGRPEVSTAALFRRYREAPDRALRNELVERHRWLAVLAARRFAHRGEPMEDLVQVAQLGLLKAVERYDGERGVPFSSFAMPTVVGELRRHFRDRTWAVHVNRRAKDLHLEVPAATEALTRRLQRPPRLAELAEALCATEDETLQALSAGCAYRTVALASLEQFDGNLVEAPALGGEHRELALAADRVALGQLLRRLPPRQQTIVALRFLGELKQADIARRLGISQVHVSRLLRDALLAMRREHEGDARRAG